MSVKRIKNLVKQLNEYRHAYYNQDAPLVSDAEYDRLFDELKELEEQTGFILSNSPTQTVGYYPVSELAKVTHPIPLLSLEKTKLISELLDFMKGQEVLFMLKLDGLTTKLIYEDGRLIQACPFCQQEGNEHRRTVRSHFGKIPESGLSALFSGHLSSGGTPGRNCGTGRIW